jgi:acetyl-CoA synthetase
MLACARIGAIHSVVFGGFSADALADRINDSDLQAADHLQRLAARRQEHPLKAIADEALAQTPSIEKVVVVKRNDEPVQHAGRAAMSGTTT